MTERRSSSTSTGVSLLTVVTVVFITLKLTSVIDWSWWWVLAPTLIPWAFVLLLILLVLPVYRANERARREVMDEDWSHIDRGE